MFEDFKSATLAEIAAFYKIGYLLSYEFEKIATDWLEKGFEGENIACLAFGLPLDTHGGADFDLALKEAGLPRPLTSHESTWIVVRYYVRRIQAGGNNAMECLSELVNFYSGHNADQLFSRPDFDAHFEDRKTKVKYPGTKYVAQEWGIENLYSMYYASDDWQYSSKDSPLDFETYLQQRQKGQKKNVVFEARKVLKEFYSLESDLPENLANLGELITE